MTTQSSGVVSGVIPAHILPMSQGGDIEWEALTTHLNWLVAVPGVEWITTTAHASEVATLTESERQQLVEHVVSVVPDSVSVVAGVFDDGSMRAAADAKRSVAAGASALLIFPSGVFAGGSQQRPESQRAHYETIASAVDVPLIIFKYPVGSPLEVPLETTLELCDAIPKIAAVKEWSYDIIEYENTWRGIKEHAPHVSVLSSFSRSLLTSLVVGSDGILSGHGSVVADLQAELFAAVQRDDLAAARAIWDRIYPLAVACYAEPFFDQHNRMKAVLGAIGRIPAGATSVRAPLVDVDASERARLLEACSAAGIQ